MDSHPDIEEAIGHKRAELDAECRPMPKAPSCGRQQLVSAAAAQLPRIEELLHAQEPFVEELFDALLDELGFPEAVQSTPQPEEATPEWPLALRSRLAAFNSVWRCPKRFRCWNVLTTYALLFRAISDAACCQQVQR
ncbi:hypothetical protein ACIQV3_37635 [Streptomyces sp. NPDC099050]|uniref:hypothetical protein n=1 Tax=Streptomyces sp. NPDC099050 TaxID=3366100 RepID=UPI0038116DC5